MTEYADHVMKCLWMNPKPLQELRRAIHVVFWHERYSATDGATRRNHVSEDDSSTFAIARALAQTSLTA